MGTLPPLAKGISGTMGMMYHRWQSGILMVVLALAAAGPAWAQKLPPPLEDYRAAIAANPQTAMNYYRVFLYARNNPAHRGEARALLERCLQRYPRGHRIEMFIAWLDQLEGRSGWEKAFRRSIDGMASGGDVFGVAYAGEILAYILIDQGRLDDAGTLLEWCLPFAEKTGKRWMPARIWSVQAVLAQVRGDYSLALHLLRRTKKTVFPEGEYDIQCSVMNNLGSVYWYLGRYRKAYAAYEEAARLRARSGDIWGESLPLSNMALCGRELVHEGEMEPDTLRELIERSLALSVRGGNAEVEAAMYNLLGQRSEGREALGYFHRAARIARRHSLHEVEIETLGLSGAAEAAMGPQFLEQARHSFEEARQRARQSDFVFLLAEIMASEARFEALNASLADAVQMHLDTIAYIEGLRAPQVRGTVRARAFSRWDYVYYRLAGLLLSRAPASPSPQAAYALAFHTMERFRARELLERMGAHRQISKSMMESELYRQHERVLTRISRVQRKLADPELEPAGRESAFEELRDLEEEESAHRDRLHRRFPESPNPSGSAIPRLHEIQSLLAPDQALLAYQLWDGEPWAKPHLDIGKSWLTLITRDRVQSFALAGRRDLRGRIEILEGLLTARDTSPANGLRASVRLYDDLLGQAIAALPEGVHRLVIIPDDALFRCPFGALRATETAPPMGRRFEISIVPSAAVWTHLKRNVLEESTAGRSAALIFFAPEVGGEREDGGTFRAAGPWRNGLHLAPLPHAAQEAAALERVSGPGSRILFGAHASEAALKRTRLAEYAILDLVTHAVVDAEQPERSSIILAPGDAKEDGLLQVREIPWLPLDGQLVILSSCGSSAGQLLGGEGAQSLARAFLEAGAGAVLASLWPLEDREAATLLAGFSEELGRGRSVAEALWAARAAAMDGGMATAGWAGVIVVGDGDLRPLPGHEPLKPGRLGLVIAAVVLLGILVIKRAL